MKVLQNYLKLMLVLALVLGLIAALGPRPVKADTLPIDDFDLNQAPGNLVLTANSGTPTASGVVDAAGILGGERDVSTVHISGAGDVTSRVATIEGYLSHSQASGVRGRTTITWDGNDNDANTLDPVGLGGIDLTSPSNDAFILGVIAADAGTQIGLTVYTNSTDFSTAVVSVLQGTNSVTVVPFSSFTPGGGGPGVDFTDVGAIVLRLNNAALATPDLDMVIDFFFAADQTQYEDLGDLPNGYSTLRASNGPRHVVSTLVLGATVDDETDGFPDASGLGDDANNTDDEDGIVRVGTWADGVNGGTINVTISGAARGCLAGWIDFDNDGDFLDADEELFFGDPLGLGINTNMTPVVAGSNTISFDIPTGTFPGTGGDVFLHARFRLVADRLGDDICYPQSLGADEPDVNSSATDTYLNGEVEDYVWGFTPTAVTLRDIQTSLAATPFMMVVFGTAAILLLVLTVYGILLLRRQRAGANAR